MTSLLINPMSNGALCATIVESYKFHKFRSTSSIVGILSTISWDIFVSSCIFRIVLGLTNCEYLYYSCSLKFYSSYFYYLMFMRIKSIVSKSNTTKFSSSIGISLLLLTISESSFTIYISQPRIEPSLLKSFSFSCFIGKNGKECTTA